MRRSPVPHLFFIGLTVSLPTTGWTQTNQSIQNNANRSIVIIIKPESKKGECIAETTSPDWLEKIPIDCIVTIRKDKWLKPEIMREYIPSEYYKPSEYELSFIKDDVYKIMPITKGMELPTWTTLVKTSTEILKSFDPKPPQQKCGKIKNLPTSKPNNPPEVCFSE